MLLSEKFLLKIFLSKIKLVLSCKIPPALFSPLVFMLHLLFVILQKPNWSE